MSSIYNTLPSIALVGNPGTGKSTILNGLVGASVFSSGISFGTGRTTRLQQHSHNDRFYFDTPGLDDIDKRKEAGEELDRLLQKDMSLKIIFVVVAMSGRIRTEDATTVRLVLDAITSVDTNDRFGVVINQMPPQFVKAMEDNEFVEKKVRSSITGNRFTSHWVYVMVDKNLECAENGCLMTPQLSKFFDSVPLTRPIGAMVSKVDTESFEERLEEERRRFEEREKLLKQELETQNIRMNALETLTAELKNILKATTEIYEESQQRLLCNQKDLSDMVAKQKAAIAKERQRAKEMRGDLDMFRAQAEKNKQDAIRQAKETTRLLEEARKSRDELVNNMANKKCSMM